MLTKVDMDKVRTRYCHICHTLKKKKGDISADYAVPKNFTSENFSSRSNFIKLVVQLEAWARNGLTDEQIAHNMGIAYSTLRVWKDKYSALSAALKKGKDVVDIQEYIQNRFRKLVKTCYFRSNSKGNEQKICKD